MQTAILSIPAMQTQETAITVAKALESVAGVENIHITLASSRARIAYNERLTSPEHFHNVLAAVGFSVAPVSGGCCGGCGGH